MTDKDLKRLSFRLLRFGQLAVFARVSVSFFLSVALSWVGRGGGGG